MSRGSCGFTITSARVFDECYSHLQSAREAFQQIPPDIATSKSHIQFCTSTLFKHCDDVRSSLSDDNWKAWIKQARNHPLFSLILEGDLITRLAYQKLRGYAGDARLLDYLYYGVNIEDNLSDWEKFCTSVTFHNRPPFIVRQRAFFIGQWADKLARDVINSSNLGHIRVLSIASGHCREMFCSRQFLNGKINLTALDQDSQSIEHTKTELYERAKLPVNFINEPIAAIIKGKSELQSQGQIYDGIYSAGLFDYLNDKTGSMLITRLFKMLSPGGQLLIANVAGSLPGIGFMELQDWNLIYRDIAGMKLLLAGADLPSKQIQKQTFEISANCVYLTIQRSLGDTTVKQNSVSDELCAFTQFNTQSLSPMRARL